MAVNQNKDQGESSSKGKYRGGNTFGKGRGRGNGTIKLYNCNQLGHHAGKYPEKRNNNQGERRT